MSSDFDVENLLQKTSPGTKGIMRSGAKRKAEAEHETAEQTAIPVRTKRRRTRTTYSKEQLQRLEGYFQMSPYPDLLMRHQIAEIVAIPDHKIQVWFQNRRAKLRKHKNSRGVQSPISCLISSSAHYQSHAYASPTPSSCNTDHLPAYFPLRDTAHRPTVSRTYTELLPPPPPLMRLPVTSHCSLPAVSYFPRYHESCWTGANDGCIREVSPSVRAVPRTPSPGLPMTPPHCYNTSKQDALPSPTCIPYSYS